jgi:hypothetical protein
MVIYEVLKQKQIFVLAVCRDHFLKRANSMNKQLCMKHVAKKSNCNSTVTMPLLDKILNLNAALKFSFLDTKSALGRKKLAQRSK